MPTHDDEDTGLGTYEVTLDCCFTATSYVRVRAPTPEAAIKRLKAALEGEEEDTKTAMAACHDNVEGYEPLQPSEIHISHTEMSSEDPDEAFWPPAAAE